MAGAPSVDDAFDALVNAERAAGAAVLSATAEVSVTEAYAAFAAAIGARTEFFKAASNWVQYAVDERVLSAICEQLGAYFDAAEVYLASLASVPREKYKPAELLLPASRLSHFADFMAAALAFRPADDLVRAVAQQVSGRGRAGECACRVERVGGGARGSAAWSAWARARQWPDGSA